MYITNVAKNQVEMKNKRNHMNSILSEVRNRICIQEIDNQRKLNGSFVNFTQTMTQSGEFSIRKIPNRKSIKNPALKKQQEITRKQSFGLEAQNNKENQLNELNMNIIQKDKPKRRSSHLEIKLDEIIKYSQMYPGRRQSRQRISNKIHKFFQQLTDKKPSQKKLPSKNNQKTRNSKFKPEASHFKDANNTDSQATKTQRCQINPDYLLKMLPSVKKIEEQIIEESKKELNFEEGYCRDEYLLKKRLDSKRITLLLKKTKKLCEDQYKSNNLSLDTIIEKNLAESNKMSRRKSRKTLGKITDLKNSDTIFLNMMKKPLSFVRKEQQINLEEESVKKFHNFIKGGTPIDQDNFDDFFNQKQICQYQDHFDIYNKVYKSVIENTKTHRIDPVSINQQTLKNAFFLNESIKKSQNIQIKRQLKQAMKKIRMIQLGQNM